MRSELRQLLLADAERLRPDVSREADGDREGTVNCTLRVESGDSSAVARWTVDQEVVGSNPTHGGNLISVVRSLSGFTQPIW